MDSTVNKNWHELIIPASCIVREKGIEGIAENPPRAAKISKMSANRDFFYDERHMEWYQTKDYELIEEELPTINPTP